MRLTILPWRSNPRMPLLSELVELFWSAYRGRGPARVEAALQQQREDKVLV